MLQSVPYIQLLPISVIVHWKAVWKYLNTILTIDQLSWVYNHCQKLYESTVYLNKTELYCILDDWLIFSTILKGCLEVSQHYFDFWSPLWIVHVQLVPKTLWNYSVSQQNWTWLYSWWLIDISSTMCMLGTWKLYHHRMMQGGSMHQGTGKLTIKD